MDKNGALHLTPFAVDGRQLLSDPCFSENAEYTRYNQTEKFNVRSSLVQTPIVSALMAKSSHSK